MLNTSRVSRYVRFQHAGLQAFRIVYVRYKIDSRANEIEISINIVITLKHKEKIPN